MAYNPFNVFRRNQKIIFSIITVIIMFVFVLQFGRGDFFEWLPRWLGSKQSYGEVMAVVDGNKVRESDLQKVQSQRMLANQFMSQAVRPALNNLASRVNQLKGQVSQANKSTIEQAISARDMGNIAELAKFLPVERLIAFYRQGRERAEADLRRLSADEKAPGPDREAAETLLKLYSLDMRPSGGFFAAAPNASRKDQLDFLLWQKKAEALGVKLTDRDVEQLIEDELAGLNRKDLEEELAKFSAERRGTTRPMIIAALRGEFLVRAAQVAVLGSGYIRGQAPSYAAGYDLFNFYQKETNPHTIALISLPVELFLPQVTQQPTDSDLREIFNKAKNTEPDPASSRPAIKDPRRLKVQWIEVTGNEPFYKTSAESLMPRLDLAAKLSGPMMEPFGVPGFGTLMSAYTVNLKEPMLDQAYFEYRDDFKKSVDDNWYSTRAGSVLETTTARPQNVAATLGLVSTAYLGVPGLNLAGPLHSADLIHQRTEFLARLRSALPFLAGPGILNLAEIAAMATAHQATKPQPLPLDAVKTRLQDKELDKLKYRVAKEDSENFRRDLEKLTGGSKDKAADAQKRIEEHVKTRGVTFGQSADFRDQYSIENDPGLAPLKARFGDPHAGLPGFAPQARFGKKFFFSDDMDFASGRRTEKPTTTFFEPQPYMTPRIMGPRPDQSEILAWRSDELPAKAPESFAAAREKCVQQWRWTKARELARNAADALAKSLNGCGNNMGAVFQKMNQAQMDLIVKLNHPEAEKKVRSFEIFDVAPLVVRRPNQFGQELTVQRFTLEPDPKRIAYVNDKLNKDLIALTGKPVGTSALLADAGDNEFYVAVVQSVTEKTSFSFQNQLFAGDGPMAGPGNAIKGAFYGQSAQAVLDEALQVLRAEFNVKDEQSDKLKEKLDSSSE